jgi:hypothetical protein
VSVTVQDGQKAIGFGGMISIGNYIIAPLFYVTAIGFHILSAVLFVVT